MNNERPWLLLVEDDPSVREMLGRVFRGEGYHVLAASNEEEALNILGRLRLDLVLLDLNLPNKDSWEIFERLNAVDPLLPVIMITARPNQLFTALGAGAAALLEKPLDFPTLLQTVKDLLAEPAQLGLSRTAGRLSEFDNLPTRTQSRPRESDGNLAAQRPSITD